MANPFAMRIDIDGMENALLMLSRFGESAGDLRRAFHEISDDFQDMERETFSRQGPGWKPLTPAYARWKAAHYPGRSILVQDGSLRDSLTGGPGYVQNISGNYMELGTSEKTAIFHHRGTVRMASRPLIHVTKGRRVLWTKIVQSHVVAEARGKRRA